MINGILKNKRILYLVGIILCAILGLTISYMGNLASSSPVILVGFVFLVGGFVLFVMRRKTVDARYNEKKSQEGEKAGDDKGSYKPPNCLVIKPDLIAFEYIEEPPGLEQKCLNDNRHYHVLKLDKLTDPLVEFILPDDDNKQRYYDPAEFANAVSMPSNKKYYTWQISTMQKVSVGIMLVVIIAMLIGVVAVGG